MRLAEKIAIVVGAGQGPGEGLGNGRATALLFARNGAKVLAVDSNLESAKETAAIIGEDGGECVAIEADVTREATLKGAVDEGPVVDVPLHPATSRTHAAVTNIRAAIRARVTDKS